VFHIFVTSLRISKASFCWNFFSVSHYAILFQSTIFKLLCVEYHMVRRYPFQGRICFIHVGRDKRLSINESGACQEFFKKCKVRLH